MHQTRYCEVSPSVLCPLLFRLSFIHEILVVSNLSDFTNSIPRHLGILPTAPKNFPLIKYRHFAIQNFKKISTYSYSVPSPSSSVSSPSSSSSFKILFSMLTCIEQNLLRQGFLFRVFFFVTSYPSCCKCLPISK